MAGFAAASPEITTAPKFKRRAVSAVRSYPKGCGPAAPTACKPAGAPPAPESNPADPSEPTVQSKPSSPPATEKNEDSSNPQVQSPNPSCNPSCKQVIEPKPLPSSNIFGPPKKRTASAIRTFPAGCGSDAKRTKAVEHEKHDLSSEIKISSLLAEKSPVLETQDIKLSPWKAVDKPQVVKKNEINPSQSRARSAEISGTTKKKPRILDKQETNSSPLKEIKPSPVVRKMAEKSPIVRKVVKKAPAVESKKNHTDENLKEGVSMTAPDDRMIVQCLMASVNCLWAKGRRRGEVKIKSV